ncbi:acetyl-CoA carboxylase biotin carboxyl carrier protein [Lactiplantibacillus paraplantarum]|uniref:Acetyl-CoA carboxylase biotin carboxyl carrier protein subunit n=1 Tax=Lactiplantibacillus paraplantarum TaxID=60520 RepID=A0A2I9CKT0_9LACO|nr:biotin/lipoyl-containing protein [Lactiplantibacillus paraplantarum]AVW09552.1 acetyl-CoA carboxylase biotin carboxyl carrier protein subunit [Lactiplantibacillus paraplantarum]AYJ37766.1 acetyl-CoA carboxylase biotin carboxyl carrier protein subunit [Lactiplantibacillus paraplantarum]ERL44500.1 acetyl-CoA carboxylase, biotin carboxyl carrier protein [Lactiplantibacillus paraplantarum]KRL50546.1 acetyl-CoA carboxylase, biotin carboxyl carrier protein [Lactiplantibacillus paraplantarum DSM 10
MELKDLDRLVEKYARQGYQHIRVKAGDLEIEVTKPTPSSATPTAPASVAEPVADEVVTLPSPMVGVVHLAPDLKVGQALTAGQELGQIESMKLFNPLVSPADGTLTAVLVADNATVEYEQPLFTMRKDR